MRERQNLSRLKHVGVSGKGHYARLLIAYIRDSTSLNQCTECFCRKPCSNM